MNLFVVVLGALLTVGLLSLIIYRLVTFIRYGPTRRALCSFNYVDRATLRDQINSLSKKIAKLEFDHSYLLEMIPQAAAKLTQGQFLTCLEAAERLADQQWLAVTHWSNDYKLSVELTSRCQLAFDDDRFVETKWFSLRDGDVQIIHPVIILHVASAAGITWTSDYLSKALYLVKSLAISRLSSYEAKYFPDASGWFGALSDILASLTTERFPEVLDFTERLARSGIGPEYFRVLSDISASLTTERFSEVLDFTERLARSGIRPWYFLWEAIPVADRASLTIDAFIENLKAVESLFIQLENTVPSDSGGLYSLTKFVQKAISLRQQGLDFTVSYSPAWQTGHERRYYSEDSSVDAMGDSIGGSEWVIDEDHGASVSLAAKDTVKKSNQ